MDNSRNTPRTILQDDGLLVVEGESGRFLQIEFRSLWLQVGNLQFHKSYTAYGDEVPTYDTRLSGDAKFRADESISIIGRPITKTTAAPLSMRPIDEPKFEWTASIGFLEEDWHVGTEGRFFIECYVPKDVFDNVLHGYISGKTHSLSVGLRTTLWVAEAHRYMPVSSPLDWFLMPTVSSGYPSSRLESGKITSLAWREAPIQASPEK